MTPEILSSLRVLLAAVGGFVVGKGWIDEGIAEALVGFVVVVVPFVWNLMAKKATSRESIQTAEKVAESDAVPHIINTHDGETS